MTPSVHDRLMASHTQMRSALATQRLDLPFAVCVITEDLPAVYDCNVVTVTNPVPPGILLRSVEKVAAMAGWRHRRVEVDQPSVADRLRAALVDAGYGEEHYATMRLATAPHTLPARVPATAVVDVGAHRDLARRVTAQEPWADSDAIVDQMLERERRLARVTDARAVVAPPDAPVSRCLLLRHGTIAEVDAVSTLTDARGRGWSTAVVLRAIAEARAAGVDDVVLVADAEDWPRHWYERLGFRVVGRSSAFRRAPTDP